MIKTCVVLSVTVLSCGGGDEKSKAALAKCSADNSALQQQLAASKKLLAQALANPGTIKIDDEQVLALVGQLPREATTPQREGTISQRQVISTLRDNKTSLQPCYQRALKRDTSLHHRAIQLTLSMRVQPSGSPVASSISIGPNYNSEMVDCMRKAIRRWRFPTFSGSAVGVESPLTFTPKR